MPFSDGVLFLENADVTLMLLWGQAATKAPSASPEQSSVKMHCRVFFVHVPRGGASTMCSLWPLYDINSGPPEQSHFFF